MSRNWAESTLETHPDQLVTLVEPARAGGMAVLPSTTTEVGVPMPVSRKVPVNRALALVSVIKGIGSPLQSAVSEVAAGLRDQGRQVTALDEARAYASLVQQVVSVGRSTCASLSISRNAVARWNGESLHWAVLEAIADLVGAHFRAAGQLQPGVIAGQVASAITLIAVEGARREDLMPGLGNATLARLGLDMLKAMPPVVHAVTRYSFGRNPLVLITEIAWELQYKAVECTRRLLSAGSTLEEWHSVYGAFVVSAGQLYAESHFAEAERLARLSPNDRAALGAGEVPMTGVWEQFDRRTEQLATFAGYMTVPASAGGEAGVPMVKSPF